MYYAGLDRALVWLRRRRTRVLVYHACETEENQSVADLRSNTPPALFALHLAMLARMYRIVPLDALARDDRPDRALAITFDDGYASVYEHAFPLLERYNVPATVFVVSSAIDQLAPVWVNELNALLRQCSEGTIRQLAATLGLDAWADAAAILSHACYQCDADAVAKLIARAKDAVDASGADRPPARPLYLTWPQVEEMRRAGITFGNHTATHPNLRLLVDRAIRDEIKTCHDQLSRRLDRVTSFAYPFGLTDSRARAVAIALGYTIIAEVGAQSRRHDPTRLGRVPVADQSPAALFADLEVVEPLKAALRQAVSRVLRAFRSSIPDPSDLAV